MALVIDDFPLHVAELQLTALVGPEESKTFGAEVVRRESRYYLKAPGQLTLVTGRAPRRLFRTQIEGESAVVHGYVCAVDGDTGVLIEQLWIGSSEPNPLFKQVRVELDHVAHVCSYQFLDGAMRDVRRSLTLPDLDSAVRGAHLHMSSASDVVQLSADQAASIDRFEPHLAALQDLITVVADAPAGYSHMVALDTHGATVRIYGRARLGRTGAERSPREYLLRLSSESTQVYLERWWKAWKECLPALQLFAGIVGSPGKFVELDALGLAAAIESLATSTLKVPGPLGADEANQLKAVLAQATDLSPAQQEVLSRMRIEISRPLLRTRLEKLLLSIGADVMADAKIDPASWLESMKSSRDTFAHGSTRPASQKLWTNSAILRAIRDSNRVVMALALLAHLDVRGQPLREAASTLGRRYASRHIAESHGIFIS